MELINKQVPDWMEQKFGANLDVGATAETLWETGGLFTWQTAAEALEIVSGAAGDTGIVVSVYGLDANYDQLTASVTTDGADGTTPVAIAGVTFIRVFRVKVTTGTPTGILTVRAVAGATVRATVTVGNNQSQMALFTVPAGYFCWVKSYYATVQKLKDVVLSLYARPFGEVFQLKNRVIGYEEHIQQIFDPPLQFSAKTDIELRAASSVATADVYGGFALLLRNQAAGPKNN